MACRSRLCWLVIWQRIKSSPSREARTSAGRLFDCFRSEKGKGRQRHLLSEILPRLVLFWAEPVLGEHSLAGLRCLKSRPNLALQKLDKVEDLRQDRLWDVLDLVEQQLFGRRAHLQYRSIAYPLLCLRFRHPRPAVRRQPPIIPACRTSISFAA